jgi:hypothetical protein
VLRWTVEITQSVRAKTKMKNNKILFLGICVWGRHSAGFVISFLPFGVFLDTEPTVKRWIKCTRQEEPRAIGMCDLAEREREVAFKIMIYYNNIF